MKVHSFKAPHKRTNCRDFIKSESPSPPTLDLRAEGKCLPRSNSEELLNVYSSDAPYIINVKIEQDT